MFDEERKKLQKSHATVPLSQRFLIYQN